MNVADFYSIMSEGSASDSDADNESRYGGDAETDEEEESGPDPKEVDRMFVELKKQYDKAVNEWKESISENPKYAMAYRNLAIAYYNKRKEPAKALAYMKQAFELDSSYPRLLLEYDQLAAKNNVALEDRLALLEKYPELVEDRDVLYLEYILLVY